MWGRWGERIFWGLCLCRFAWHLIPSSFIEKSACLFLLDASPLLEEECHASIQALVAQIEHPRGGHGTGARPRFAADNDPIYVGQIQFGQWPQQGFKGEESHGCRHFTQPSNPINMPVVFDGDAHPNV